MKVSSALISDIFRPLVLTLLILAAALFLTADFAAAETKTIGKTAPFPSEVRAGRNAYELNTKLADAPPKGGQAAKLAKSSAASAAGAMSPSFYLPRYWNQNFTDGFNYAMEHRKMMVVLFGSDWCPRCIEQAREIAQSALLSPLQSCVEFAFADVGSDEFSQKMAGALELEGYPALAFIRPGRKTTTFTGRITGLLKTRQVEGAVRLILEKTADENEVDIAGVIRSSCNGLEDLPPFISFE